MEIGTLPPGPSGIVGQVVHQTNPGAIVHKGGTTVLPHTVQCDRAPLKAQRVTMETSQKFCTYICFTSLPSAPLPCPPSAPSPCLPSAPPLPLCPGPPLPSAMLQDSTSLVPTCPRQPPAGPDPSCRVGGSTLPGAPRVLLACCLPCLTDPGTGSGLGQELMAFLLCHFMLLTIPPPQEINLCGICFLWRHMPRAAGQRLSHWQWSPLSPTPSPRGLCGLLPFPSTSWPDIRVLGASVCDSGSAAPMFLPQHWAGRRDTHGCAGASYHRVFCLGPKHGRARGPRSPPGRSQSPHLAHQLVTLQGERAGGQGPRGEDIQHSRPHGPFPGLK